MKDLALKTFVVSLVSILTLVFLYVFYKSSTIFLSALIGVGVSCLMTPFLVQLQEKFKIPKALGAVLLLLSLFLFFILLFYLVGAIFVDQYESLKSSLPDIIENWQNRWMDFADKNPQIKMFFLERGASSTSSITSSIFSYLSVTFSGLASAITGISLATVIALFTSVNADKYYNSIIGALPKNMREKARERLHLTNLTLRKWFTAQLIDMGFVFLLTSVFLGLFGVDYWFLFGLMTGILSIVPFVGIMASVITASCVIAVVQPDKILYLWGIFFVTQQIEGNIILPKLMNSYAQIPAAPLLFFMMLMGSWFGFLGVFITPPLLAIFIAQYKQYKAV